MTERPVDRILHREGDAMFAKHSYALHKFGFGMIFFFSGYLAATGLPRGDSGWAELVWAHLFFGALFLWGTNGPTDEDKFRIIIEYAKDLRGKDASAEDRIVKEIRWRSPFLYSPPEQPPENRQ